MSQKGVLHEFSRRQRISKLNTFIHLLTLICEEAIACRFTSSIDWMYPCLQCGCIVSFLGGFSMASKHILAIIVSATDRTSPRGTPPEETCSSGLQILKIPEVFSTSLVHQPIQLEYILYLPCPCFVESIPIGFPDEFVRKAGWSLAP